MQASGDAKKGRGEDMSPGPFNAACRILFRTRQDLSPPQFAPDIVREGAAVGVDDHGKGWRGETTWASAIAFG